MDTLPQLVIDEISSELSTSDLLACSLVSVGWRAAFNCNFVWKKICLKTANTVTIEHVQTVSSTVSQTFEEPEDSTLEPLCHWRVVYLKLQQVNRNWQRSNHAELDIFGVFYSQNPKKVRVHDSTLVALKPDGNCEFWNVKEEPKKQQVLVLALLKHSYLELIHLCEDTLVIAQDLVLQIFVKRDNLFVLSHRCLFNLVQPLADEIPLSANIDKWYKNYKDKGEIEKLSAVVIGKYFIGLVEIPFIKRFYIHIWDTVTGSKLKEEYVSNTSHGSSIRFVTLWPPKTYLDKVLVSVYCTWPDTSTVTNVYIYDLVTLAFKTVFVVDSSLHYICYEATLFLTIKVKIVPNTGVDGSTTLSTFSSSSGDMIASKVYKNLLNPQDIQVSRDYLSLIVYDTEIEKYSLVIFNIKQDLNLIFKSDMLLFFFDGFATSLFYGYSFIGWNLVVISYNNKVEVWSIKEQKLLNTKKVNGVVIPSNNFTKLILYHKRWNTTFGIYNFW